MLDSSGRDNHGENRGARYVRLGEGEDFALQFDSLDASVDFGDRPDFDLRSHLTLEMWVHPVALPGRREIAIAGKGFSSYLLSFTDSLWFYIDGGSNHCAAEIALGRWHHVVATYDRREMRLYVDGESVARRAQDYAVARGDHFFLRPPVPAEEKIETPWSFTLDDVRIYSRALPAEEVLRHYEAEAARRPG